ncbi:MAG: hypothetical protein NVSMB18_34420 [Acetobacteraceae bacterium]
MASITSTGLVTNQSSQTITGTADPNGTVDVYDNSGTTALATVTADAGGAWTASVTLIEGANSLTTTSTLSGTTSAPSAAVSYTLDTVLPAAPSITSGGLTTNQATQTVTGSAEANSTVKIYDNSGTTPLATVVANGAGAWSSSVALGADGSHSLTVTATDAAGNTSFPSSASVYTLDTVPPVAPSITTPGLTTNQAIQTVAGTAEANGTVTIYDNGGSTPLATVVTDAFGGWSTTVNLGADGTHDLTATATDAAGNVSLASVADTYTLDTMPPPAPTITSTGDLTNQPIQIVIGTAEAGSIVNLYEDGDSMAAGTVLVDGGGNWNVLLDLGTDGTHSLTATAVDTAGNVSADSTAANYMLDTQAPETPTITSTAGLIDDATQTITGTAEVGSIVNLYDNGNNGVLASTMADSAGEWTASVHFASAGPQSVTATATDAAGNISTVSDAAVYAFDPSVPTTEIDPVTHVRLPSIDPSLDGSFSITDVTIDRSGGNEGDSYTGPVADLQHQFIWTGTQGVAVTSHVGNTFLHGGSGDDALQVTSGSNVLDGGVGSNFLVGALGTDGGADTFFVDARSGAPTWTTVDHFHVGDKVAIWGFQNNSTAAFVGIEGATGYTGATMRAQVNGHDSSVTFAGLSMDDASQLTLTSGSVQNQSYLLVTRTA